MRLHLWRKTALGIAVCLAFAGVGLAQDVHVSFDSDANFSTYRTYSLPASEQSERLEQLTDQQIQRAIVAALAAKGLSRVETGRPDLYVVYEAAISSEQRVNPMTAASPPRSC